MKIGKTTVSELNRKIKNSKLLFISTAILGASILTIDASNIEEIEPSAFFPESSIENIYIESSSDVTAFYNQTRNNMKKSFELNNQIQSEISADTIAEKIDSSKNLSELKTAIEQLIIIDEHEQEYTIDNEFIQNIKKHIISTKKDTLYDFLESKTGEFYIPNLDEDIAKDFIQSAILYQYLNIDSKNKPLFGDIKEIDERINLTAKTLATIGYLETGSYDFSPTMFSSSKAYGTFQINGSTSAETIVFLMEQNNIGIENIDISSYKGKYPYHKIKQIVSENEKLYKKRTGKGWSSNYKEKQINNMLSFARRFIYALKVNEKNNRYIPYSITDNNRFKESISNENKWNLAIKTLVFLKDRVNQGILSLKVFENKINCNKIDLSNNENNLVNQISKGFEKYNADYKNRVQYNGVNMTNANKYKLKGSEKLDYYGIDISFLDSKSNDNISNEFASL